MSNTVYITSVGTEFKKESLAAGTITPGNFIKRNANNKFVRQDTASVRNSNLVAVENSIGGDLNTDYTTDQSVVAVYCQPGDVVYATVAASAEAIAVGDKLEFNNSGNVQILGTGNYAMALALEAVDNSAAATVARLKIEII